MGLDIEKALTTAETAGVGGGVLIPEKIQEGLIEIVNTTAPVTAVLSKREIPWSTNSYEWNVRSDLMTARFYNQSTAFSASESTYVRRTSTIRMMESEGTVSNLLRETSKGWIDAVAAEIESATKSLAVKKEDALVRQSAETDGFDPLFAQISTSVDALASSITFVLLDKAIQAVQDAGGVPDIIILANRDVTQLLGLLRDKGLYQLKGIKAGGVVIELPTYNGIVVVGSSRIPTNVAYGGTPVQTSYGFVLDTSQLVIPVNKPVTYEEVPATTDSFAFRVKTYLTLAVRVPEKNCRIVNIAAPA